MATRTKVTAKVAGQQQATVARERVIGTPIGLLPGLGQIQYQHGFINLYPVTPLGGQFGQHLRIGLQQLG